MENKKYFTPDIEDIRVGYECEVLINDIWNKVRVVNITGMGLKFLSMDERSEWTFTNLDGYIRALYLTKEQIEAEGWKDSYNSCKKGYVYKYEFENNVLVIFKISTAPFIDEVLFKGECKDINTLRYICKLLKI